MAYTYDPIFAADPSNAANVAASASITIFDPNDPTKAPVAITDVTGSPLPNPITVNEKGFGPAFQHTTLDRVGWFGAGFTNYFTAYEGMKDEAVAARQAAEAAASEAGAAAQADLASRIAAGEFKGAPGKDGANVLPTDDAIEQAVKTPGTKTEAALSATILTIGNSNFGKPVSSRFAEVERQQSYARARVKSRNLTPLPTSPNLFTSAAGQASRISFPSNWSYDTPIPLVIQFRGLDATGDTFQGPALATAANDMGFAFAVSAYHGNSYGSPTALQDALDLYHSALKLAPISGVVLWGNSMGGAGALNALTTGAFPDPLGVYLTDPVVSLRQRYDNGRSTQIQAAYGIASNGSDYATKTAGYDPALEQASKFRGVPMAIVASSGDTSVPLVSHGKVLFDKLSGYSPITLFDTNDAGHNIASRFRVDHFKAFLLQCVGSTLALPDQPAPGVVLDYSFDALRASVANGSAVTSLASTGSNALALDKTTTGSTKPTLVHSGPGGHASLSFSGTNVITSGTGDVNTPVLFPAGQELTFVLVAKINTMSETVRIMGIDYNPTPSNYRYIKPLAAGGVAGASSRDGGGVTTLSSVTSVQNEWAVVIVSQSATDSFIRVNSRAQVTGAFALGQMNGLRIGATGAAAPAANSFFTGEIARVQVHNKALTLTEATSLAADMMTTYGITG